MGITKHAIIAVSLLVSGSAIASREMAQKDAQTMASAMQKQADIAKISSLDADKRAVQTPTNANIMDSLNKQKAADASQDAADAAQSMADDLCDY